MSKKVLKPRDESPETLAKNESLKKEFGMPACCGKLMKHSFTSGGERWICDECGSMKGILIVVPPEPLEITMLKVAHLTEEAIKKAEEKLGPVPEKGRRESIRTTCGEQMADFVERYKSFDIWVWSITGSRIVEKPGGGYKAVPSYHYEVRNQPCSGVYFSATEDLSLLKRRIDEFVRLYGPYKV